MFVTDLFHPIDGPPSLFHDYIRCWRIKWFYRTGIGYCNRGLCPINELLDININSSMLSCFLYPKMLVDDIDLLSHDMTMT